MNFMFAISSMRKIIECFLTLATLVACSMSHAQNLPNPFPPGSVITFPPLANGLKIVLRENHALPIVAMEVVIHTGAAAEAGMPGVAHFLEHVSFEGTVHFPNRFGAQYALECRGGFSNAITKRDIIRYNGSVASDQVSVLSKVLADIVLHPLLSDQSVTAQRAVITAECEHQQFDPVTELVNAAYASTCAEHPYGVAPVGSLQDIARVTPTMVRDFHAHWFVPNNMTVVLVGDISVARAQAVVQEAFSDVPATVLPSMATLNFRFLGAAVNVHFKSNLPTMYQIMAFPASPVTDFKSYIATQLLASLLINKADALLPVHWANAGLHVGQYGQEYVAVRYPGRLLIWAQTPPAEVDVLFKSTLATMAALKQTKLDAQTLMQAKGELAQRFVFENATYSDQAATLACYAGVGDVANSSDYLPIMQAITEEEVRAMIPTTYLARVTLGP